MAIKKYTSGAWVPTIYRKYGTETDTITNLPAQIIGDGQVITSCQISGNTLQDGTPTPEAPVDVVGCGVRTGNLWKLSSAWANSATDVRDLFQAYISLQNDATIVIFNSMNISAKGRYNLSVRADIDCNTIRFKHNGGARDLIIGSFKGDFKANTFYNISFNVNGYNSKEVGGISVSDIMLNTGSTHISYEPYGYKLPLTIGGTEYPIYLGQVETTRRIKKYVFTGEENGTIYSTSTSRKGIEITGIPGVIGGTSDIAILAICTHYQPNTRTNLYRNTDNGISNAYQSNRIIFYDASYQTVEAFQQFCAQQYANGTPVTVWYVLETPETAVVNEPLMKIGGYADTVTATNIPTTGTPENFDVGTTLKPSEVQLTYHGWHEHEDTKYTQGE